MDKNKWIEQVMQSYDSANYPELRSGLKHEIISKLPFAKAIRFRPAQVYNIFIAACFVLIFNIAAITYLNQKSSDLRLSSKIETQVSHNYLLNLNLYD